MAQIIGQVREIFRYPVKSMAGLKLDHADLDWHGLIDDRRFAFRLHDSNAGFPWLTAGRLPCLIRYRPCAFSETGAPTEVETPEGRILDLWGEELRTELSELVGSKVEVMNLSHGMFDEAGISIITSGTMKALATEAGRALDVRRFRPNIVIETIRGQVLEEDFWVGKVLCLGKSTTAPTISITKLDQRCSMINLDPDTAESDPAVLKASVRLNNNNAGVYGTVTRVGGLAVGDPVFVPEV